MIAFCPTCGTILYVLESEGKLILDCPVCPFVTDIISTLRFRTYCKLKDVDDVLGGEEAWKNVDSTEVRCPKCSHSKAYFMQLQTRSADEPMTTFYRCCNHDCSYNWREYAVKRAVHLLNNSEVIALPTDTVYGLACSAVSPKAIRRLYEIKERNENKPVAICLGRLVDVARWARVDHLPEGLLQALLPGPVTLLLKAAAPLDKSLLSKDGHVGIRVSNNPFVQTVATKLSVPIALTSANSSGCPSSLCTDEFRSLWPQVACVFDQGLLGDNAPCDRDASTVVDLTRIGRYKIIRHGIGAGHTKYVLTQFKLQCIL